MCARSCRCEGGPQGTRLADLVRLVGDRRASTIDAQPEPVLSQQQFRFKLQRSVILRPYMPRHGAWSTTFPVGHY